MRRFGVTLAVFLLAASLSSAQQYSIKFATIAPEGSTWVKVLRDLDKALRDQSAGRLGLKIYPGGVAGDEKDVIRKIRLGQYNAGGFTGVGVNDAAKKLRILDSPFLFRSYDEADFITQRFENDFVQALNDGGFVLLGWAEVGFLYIFSDVPIASLDDLRRTKPWLWEGDPIADRKSVV
jgi:TRAP-type C4-dicarboxylate transport system substrate-binding protein